MTTDHGPHPGPICPCGHPVAGHSLGGCLDNQWFEGPPEDDCPCELTEDEAQVAASQGSISS